jgi:hypothetical protein
MPRLGALTDISCILSECNFQSQSGQDGLQMDSTSQNIFDRLKPHGAHHEMLIVQRPCPVRMQALQRGLEGPPACVSVAIQNSLMRLREMHEAGQHIMPF